MKLLIADDERWIRKGIRKMIEQGNHSFEQIDEAGTLEEFETVFLRERPEIVVSDVRFPTDASCELCQKLYNLVPGTKFIMLSGYDDFEYVKAALGYKAVDYLLKPVDKQVLNKVIQKAVLEWEAEQGIHSPQQGENVDNSSHDNGEQIIRRIMEEIQKDCTKKFSLRFFSEKYHISEAYLSNLFARVAGISLMNFIMRERVEKAVSLMLQTSMKISDVAEAVGYRDTRYFAKIFKKFTGETPTDYRQRQKWDREEEERHEKR